MRTPVKDDSEGSLKDFELTRHARKQIQERGLSEVEVMTVLAYGKVVEREEGRDTYRIGDEEIEKYSLQGLDLQKFREIYVVCAGADVVVTAYKKSRVTTRIWRF